MDHVGRSRHVGRVLGPGDRKNGATRRTTKMRTTLITLILAMAPRVALACPVCFGQNDSPLAVAMNLGIIAMLVVVAGMLGAFATFFIYLNRRAKMVAAKQSSEGTA
jgi:hypothetical protein